LLFRTAWTVSLLFVLPYVAGMTGTPYHTQLLVEMESWELFAWDGLKPWSSWSLSPKKLGLQAWTIVPALNSAFNQIYTLSLCAVFA
jgi:hypothetical protein